MVNVRVSSRVPTSCTLLALKRPSDSYPHRTEAYNRPRHERKRKENKQNMSKIVSPRFWADLWFLRRLADIGEL